ncbi:50S ribosomal protein L11 methyltransferase [Marinobacterium marinum]|uniref:Ribosomal protein L11 methyltransferase n=1 Tax=Marinobacterium marinum TaxID=2756129 RepID=A0A7W1WWA6_9GAMM|nr:50S ribosomal protein L11 methyltransferase [Marinobacterium marinum]MBA4501399.1 50S ribosomal protein L11 methyltransferase [Marinobacterium marinum]
MPWLQIKVSIPPEQADTYEDLLLAAGCAAVTYQDAADQPIFEPDLGTTPLWNSTVVTGLFAAEHDLRETLDLLHNAQQSLSADLNPLPEFKAEILEDKDWEREWMDHYHPMQFGRRLWVCPSWREAPEPGAVNLMLDPGLAFGTGTHPTTALCLEWLDAQTLDDRQVVDYGCGSGILGIAALLLGARHVQAIDIDPQALTATRDNLERNRLPAATLDTFLPLDAPLIEADLLVANILAGPLCQLAPTLAARVKPNGRILLSGLLSQQADEIVSTYSQWFEMDAPGEREGWIRISGTRKQES